MIKTEPITIMDDIADQVRGISCAEIMSAHGCKPAHTSTGKRKIAQYICPFHGDKTPSFTVYNDNNSFYCYGCGTGGSGAISLEKCFYPAETFPQVIKRMAKDYLNIDTGTITYTPEQEKAMAQRNALADKQGKYIAQRTGELFQAMDHAEAEKANADKLVTALTQQMEQATAKEERDTLAQKIALAKAEFEKAEQEDADTTEEYQKYTKADRDTMLDGFQEWYDRQPTAEQWRYTFDDTGNGEMLLARNGNDFLYDATNREILYWTGTRWKLDVYGRINQAANQCVRVMSDELYKRLNDTDDKDTIKAINQHIKYTRRHTAKLAMVEEFKSYITVSPEDFDLEDNILNCKNGMLDLNTGIISKQDPQDRITKECGAQYNPLATCHRWEQFMAEICCGDMELASFIKRAVGYSLAGGVQEQVMFFLVGGGSNGKSTFLSTIRSVMGDYARTIRAQTLMTSGRPVSGGTATPDIAALAGARLVIGTEPNEDERLDESLVKQMTGGTDLLTVRKLHGSPFSYLPKYKIWIGTNHKPIIRGTDNGIWRRIMLIPFNASFKATDCDPYLFETLKKERDGILAWAYDGYLEYKNTRLNPPKVVTSMTSEYRTEMDDIGQFIDDKCDQVPGKTISATQLYATYCDWTRDNGRYTMSGQAFGRKMSERQGITKKRMTGGWWYYGIAVHP